MAELQNGGRNAPPLTSMTLNLSQENAILHARVKVLEAKSRWLRAELDWMREKFLAVESMIWFGSSDHSVPDTVHNAHALAAAEYSQAIEPEPF